MELMIQAAMYFLKSHLLGKWTPVRCYQQSHCSSSYFSLADSFCMRSECNLDSLPKSMSHLQYQYTIIGVANYVFLWLYRCTCTVVQETKIANQKIVPLKVNWRPQFALKMKFLIILLYRCTVLMMWAWSRDLKQGCLKTAYSSANKNDVLLLFIYLMLL